MKLPPDIEILQAAANSPLDTLGYQWVEPGHIPFGYDEAAGVPEDVAAAWRRLFQELTFIAKADDGEWIALWKYRDDLPLTTAPIVVLDTEGQLRSAAPTLADHLLQTLEGEEFKELRNQLRETGIQTLPSKELITAAVRFHPDPQQRFENILSGYKPTVPARDEAPAQVLDLLRMRGEDRRVAAYLAKIENPDNPIELRCDGDGLVSIIFLSPQSVNAVVYVQGIKLGGPVSSLTALGKPEIETPHWKRWIIDREVVHVEAKESKITRITVWFNSAAWVSPGSL